MNEKYFYFDRKSQRVVEEKIYAERVLRFLYSQKPFSNIFLSVLSKLPISSKFIGLWQRMPWTKGLISPFVKRYELNTSEFEKPLGEFSSFNDFFIRKLKAGARLISANDAVMPADGCYRFYPNLSDQESIFVKGKGYKLEECLQDARLATRFKEGSLVHCTLAPYDYHRFHFPIDCIASAPRLINGPLYSVQPLSIKQNIAYLLENKRKITELQSEKFGLVLALEIGATSVGSIVETFTPRQSYKKGYEKGYFSFGGSAILLFFEKGRISFDKDLLEANQKGFSIHAQMGESMGRAL